MGKHLVDAGILHDSDKGDPLMPGKTIDDAREALEARAKAEIRRFLEPLHAFYRE
jgi:hypothetical protein